ncbi:CHAT domain-containing protein [Flavobacterium sp.]|uniref:CHAT domain-containing protein n=5 Tax=Flavobacterium sp. TaxID=239 RepID=UPI004048292B
MKFLFPFLILSAFVWGQSLPKAQYYLDHSDYKHAIPLFEKIGNKAKQNHNLNEQVTAQNGLADCYIDLGGYYKAKVLLENNLNLLQKHNRKHFLLLAQTHQLLAQVYDKLFLFEEYKKECDLFYSYYCKAYPKIKIHKSLYYSYLGRYYNMRNLIDKAYYYTNNAIKIYNANPKEQFLIEPYILYNSHLFTLRNRTTLPFETKMAYKDTLDYYLEKRYPYDNVKKTRLIISQVALYLDKLVINDTINNSNFEILKKAYTRSQRLTDKLVGYYYPPSANVASLLGLINFYKKDYSKALYYYDDGIRRLQIYSKANKDYLTNSPFVLLNLLHWKVWCLNEMYDKNPNLSLLYESKKTLNLMEEVWIRYSNQIFYSKASFNYSDYSDCPYTDLLNLNYKLYQFTKKNIYLNNFFEYNEKLRYSGLIHNYVINKNYPGVKTNIKLMEQYETFMFKTNKNSDFSSQATLVNTNSKNEQIFLKKLRSNLISIEEIQNKLSHEDAMIVYNMIGNHNKRHIATIITKNKVELLDLKIKEEELSTIDIDTLLSYLHNNSLDQFKKESYSIYKKIFYPISKKIPHAIKKITIVPSPILANLPFDLLITTPFSKNKNEAPRYLVKKYAINYIISPSIDKIILPKTNNNIFSVYLPSSSNHGLPKLTTAFKNGKDIINTYDAKGFIDTNATRKNFVNSLRQDKSIAVLTHGKSDNDETTNTKGIYFSDSFLNMDAIYKLSSSTELLILGACETNIGFKSTEGTINLGRAFTAIGVKSMLLSSWAIDEQSSIQIIRSFLKYLDAGYTKSEALQKAKLDYLATASPRTANPLYWAGLNITGNNENIRLQERNYWWWGFGILSVFIGVVLIAYYKFYSKK